jgi:hypothetical protein
VANAGSFDNPDRNAGPIIAALRQAGALVTRIRGEKGLPDLLISHKHRVMLAEVKTLKGRLSEAQERFHAVWGCVHVLRTPEEAIEMLRRAE